MATHARRQLEHCLATRMSTRKTLHKCPGPVDRSMRSTGTSTTRAVAVRGQVGLAEIVAAPSPAVCRRRVPVLWVGVGPSSTSECSIFHMDHKSNRTAIRTVPCDNYE